MVYLTNSMSLQMLDLTTSHTVKVTPVTETEIREANPKSIVGHQDTANVLATLLGVEVPMNRECVSLKGGDTLYVGQLTGGRLPEGATTLPAGFVIAFVRVDID